MSDAIDRDAVEAILRRRVDGCYGDCTTQCLSCAAKEDIEEIRSLPAVPPAAERRNCIRLRIDKDDTMGVTIWHGTARVWMDGDSLSGEEWASTDLASVVRWIRAQTDQFAAAYRAAPPASPGAAPPAAEPAPTTYSEDDVAAILRNFGIDVSCGACAAIAFTGTAPGLSHECGQETPELVVTEPAPRTTTTGAIVSALAQMGLAQLAEPAAQPFRHGRCCAEEPKEPAPCGQCGGSGQVFDSPRVGPFDTKSACPECSPGGAA